MTYSTKILEETIKHFISNCSNLNADRKSKLSSKTSSALFEDRANPLSFRALMQLALRWDTSKNRSRFLSDVIAKTPHLWVGKIFSSHGVTDEEKAWQTRRAKALLSAERAPETPILRPSLARLELQSGQLRITDSSINTPNTTNLSPPSDLFVEEAIRFFVQFCFCDAVGVLNSMAVVDISGSCSNEVVEFLTIISRLTYILPLTISVIADTPVTLSSLFENPKLDGTGLFWFCAVGDSYSCVGAPRVEEVLPANAGMVEPDISAVINIMIQYQKDFITANVDLVQAQSDIISYIEMEKTC